MLSMLLHLDQALFTRINAGWSNPVFDCLLPVISRLVDPEVVWIWVVLISLLACRRLARVNDASPSEGRLVAQRWKACLVSCLTVAFIYGVTAGLSSGLKDLFSLPRPFLQQTVTLRVPPETRLDLERSGALPSGHTCSAFTVAALFAALFGRKRVLFYSLAGTVGLSRIYLGVHYPSDVLAGALLGWTVTLLLLGAAPIRRRITGEMPRPAPRGTDP